MVEFEMTLFYFTRVIRSRIVEPVILILQVIPDSYPIQINKRSDIKQRRMFILYNDDYIT